jgi:hypothetical protein
MPGTYVSVTSGNELFSQSEGSLFIKGGNFIISALGKRFAALSGVGVVEFNADVESIKVLSSSPETVIQTTGVGAPNFCTKILKAETIDCKYGFLAKVELDNLTIKVRNLTTGLAAIDIQDGSVNLSISDGRYNCGNTLLSTGTTDGTLNLSLYNTVVKQGGLVNIGVDAPIFNLITATNTIRVDGFGSSIEGVNIYTETGVSIAHIYYGSLIISNVTLVGSIIVSLGKLTLNSVFIRTLEKPAPATGYFNSIYTGNDPKTIYILGDVCSTGDKTEFIQLATNSGSLRVNTAFAI